MLYYKKLFISLMFMLIYILSSLYSSAKPYSINKNFESLGETRNIAELMLSTNRNELKDKIEQTIFESSVRNSTLKLLADITWSFQKNSVTFDYQFFNTEIYFGKLGEVFPKYTHCEKYNYDKLKIEPISSVEYIFLLMPMKQEIENDKVHSFQKKYSLCNNLHNFKDFQNRYEENRIHILNTYDIFSDENNRFYEFGDTHWNDLGVKSVFSKILEITHNKNIVSISRSNRDIKENNLILKRLGLIDEEFFQDEYIIDFKTDNKKTLLIIHDSFFEESYVSIYFLEQFYKAELLTWNYLKALPKDNAYNLINKYDYVIFESSIDSFFVNRVLFFSE